MKMIKRHEKVAFYGVPGGTSGDYTYHRMKGFDSLSTSKNPKEYSRQYVDEEFERTDVVGYSDSISFGFDRIEDDAVHEDIAAIFDERKLGADAQRPIVIVDMFGTTRTARQLMFSVIPESEGDDMDAYSYSGTFKSNGDTVKGTAASTDEWLTCTFTEDRD